MIKRLDALMRLFGSKCLPDVHEDNFTKTEPKYRINDKVVYCGERRVIAFVNPMTKDCERTYRLTGVFGNIKEHELTPYEEPKPAEPKFKVGDKVKVHNAGDVYNGAIGEIVDINDYGSCYVLFPHNQAWFRPSALEPYTEPTADYVHVDGDLDKSASTCTDDCQSQCKSTSASTLDLESVVNLRNKDEETKSCDSSQNHIGEDSEMVDHSAGSGNMLRLHIAAQIVPAIMAGGGENFYYHLPGSKSYMPSMISKRFPEGVAHVAFIFADALISESKKGGSL